MHEQEVRYDWPKIVEVKIVEIRKPGTPEELWICELRLTCGCRQLGASTDKPSVNQYAKCERHMGKHLRYVFAFDQYN